MMYLALAVACSLAIGTVFKYAGREGIDFMRLLTVNYLTASVFALVLLLTVNRPAEVSVLASPAFVVFCLVAGAIMIGGFLIFARATHRAGMSVSMAVMRMGVSIPFVVSWLVWNETPSPIQWAGVALVAVALLMITRREDRGPDRPLAAGLPAVSVAGLLTALFFVGGAGDLAFKTFDIWFGSRIGEDAFIAATFGFSFLMGVGVLAMGPATARRFSGVEIRWGVFLGLINYGSVLFILGAVARIPGTVVFPTNALSIVVGGALLGVLLFKERLSTLNKTGVAIAAVAVVLLNG